MSLDKPKVSIIMPTLNVKNYIAECLDSVVNQTLEDIEIIVVDAGSTDGTLEILKEYADKDSRITLLDSDEKSYGHQMNMGISQAKGEYIGIVETDDYIDSKMFEDLYKLSNGGEYDIIKSNFIYINEDTGEVYKDRNIYKKKIPDDGPFNLKDNAYLLTGHPSIWAAIYRRDFLSIHEIKFVEAPGGGWVDNQFFHETACLAKTIRYTDEAYYYYRESNPDSSSNKLNDYTLPIRRMLDNLDVIDKYPECKTEEVLKCVYWRVNIYMDNIQSRDAYEENLPIVRPYIEEMMGRLEEPVVLKHFSIKDQQRYYSFLSPFDTLQEGDSIEYGSEDYWSLKRERDFLIESVRSQGDEIAQLRKKNKKLKKFKKKNKKLKKYKKEYESILNSSSWKLTKPLRSFKRIFK
jgi:glycosyltransferase involved in cell wall biosynthesis